MAQVYRCDVCGALEESAQAPPHWGYVYRPIDYAVPTADLPKAQKTQRKDLCGGCSSALGKVLDELRRRLQKKEPGVSIEERHDVVSALLTSGEERVPR